MAIRSVLGVLVAVSITTGALVVRSAPAAAQVSVDYRPPVDAPVADPFRAPDTPYGAGNRGLTYDVPAATPVSASAPGEVVFAGPVAGSLHVTVLHPDGLRTSYSFLEAVAVHRGQRVEAGDLVGAGGAGFHFGVRDGDAYLDPAALFGGTEIRVRLVPHEEPLPPTDAGLLRERLAIIELVDNRNVAERAFGMAKDILGEGIDRLKAGIHVYQQIAPIGSVAESLLAAYTSLSSDCTPAAEVPAVDADGRMALLVAGYASSSEHAGIDDLEVDELGYRPADVLRYSYAGGRTPDPDGGLDPALVGIPARPYEPADTFGDLEAEGRALADLIQEAAEARPGVPIDLYAHSQGGIVTRLALLELADRPGGLDALGSVVTLGTPHDGADLATIGSQLSIGDHRDVQHLAELVGADIDSTARSVKQMSETSDLIVRLKEEGVPEGVDFRTIGARGDLVVTGDKTRVSGHASAMIDLAGPAAHGNIPSSAQTTRELAAALAGVAPTCEGVGDQLLDAVVPEVISYASNGLGAAMLIGG